MNIYVCVCVRVCVCVCRGVLQLHLYTQLIECVVGKHPDGTDGDENGWWGE
jgi:hypothetical protein